MAETTNIKVVTQLLQNVTAIRGKYDEINRLTGADYNIFNVLKLKSDEVRLHSRFIGDLLNPKGKHGRGDVFLNLFLEQIQASLNGSWKKDFYSKNAKVYIEKSIGSINEDKTEGGQIDLVIEDCNNKRIIIENKIYASDQYNQLLRYHNYDSKALIIYLTLFGKAPIKYSVGNNNFPIITLSYKKDVLDWLKKCSSISTKDTFFMDMVNQYIVIIKQLTRQSDKNMEIMNIVFSSVSNVEAYEAISKQYEKRKLDIYRNFRLELQERLQELLKDESKDLKTKIRYCLNNSYDIEKRKYEEIKTQLSFEYEADCKNVISEKYLFKNKLIFEFSRMYKDGKVQQSFYFGFRYDNDTNNQNDYLLNDRIKEIIDENLLNKPDSNSKYWLGIKYRYNGEKEIKFNSSQFIVLLNDKKKRAEIVKDLASEMFEVIKANNEIKNNKK